MDSRNDADFIRDIRMLVYNDLASAVLLYWVAIISFQQEVNLVWKSPTSPIKILYFILRYGGLIYKTGELLCYVGSMHLVAPSISACKRCLIFQEVCGLLLLFAIDVLLTMRASAFLGSRGYSFRILLALFAFEWITAFTILGIMFPHSQDVKSVPGVLSCLAVNHLRLFPVFWIPALVFHTVIFTFIMIEFLRDGSRGPLLYKFVRDGVWAFAALFCVLLTTVVAFEMRPPVPLVGLVTVIWQSTIIAYCGPQLIINLRDFATQTAGEIAMDNFDLGRSTR